MARQGEAGQGVAGLGLAWLGVAWYPMTTRGPNSERDEELAALMRLQELPDFAVYLALLQRHAEDLRRSGHKVLIDEKAIAGHNYRAGQVDGLLLASRLPELIEQARRKLAPEHEHEGTHA